MGAKVNSAQVAEGCRISLIPALQSREYYSTVLVPMSSFVTLLVGSKAVWIGWRDQAGTGGANSS